MKMRPVLFTVPLALLALALAGGSNLLIRLFLLSVLVLFIGYLWTLFGIRGIRVRVKKPPDHSQVGESFDEEFTVSNSSKLPKLLLIAEENTDLPGYHNVSALNLSPGSSRYWQTKVHCRRRGRYTLGSITATVTDPFGLFSRHRNLGEPQQIIVYPETVELPFFKLSSLNGSGYGSNQRSINQLSPIVSNVREYVTGDSLNHIHWHSTAHTGQLMVKVFDPDRSYDGSKSIWVIADMHQASHLVEGEEATEEYGVTIAASLIKKCLDSGIRAGLITSDDPPQFFPAERGEQHLRDILETLALMKASGKVPIDQFITDWMEHFKGNATVIIITPSVTGEVVAATRQLKKHGNTVAAVLLDSASFGGTNDSLKVARSLSSNGVQVYLVRKGDELAKALDSRVAATYTRYT